MIEPTDKSNQVTKAYLFSLVDVFEAPLTLRTINILTNSETITKDEDFLSYTDEDWKKIEHVKARELKELRKTRTILNNKGSGTSTTPPSN